jgi:hypothetical protein
MFGYRTSPADKPRHTVCTSGCADLILPMTVEVSNDQAQNRTRCRTAPVFPHRDLHQAGQIVHFGIQTDFAGGQSWAFSSLIDAPSLTAFTDRDNSLVWGEP